VSDPTTIGASEKLELTSAYSGQLSFAADTGILKLDCKRRAIGKYD
jgi:hypothetical protein